MVVGREGFGAPLARSEIGGKAMCGREMRGGRSGEASIWLCPRPCMLPPRPGSCSMAIGRKCVGRWWWLSARSLWRVPGSPPNQEHMIRLLSYASISYALAALNGGVHEAWDLGLQEHVPSRYRYRWSTFPRPAEGEATGTIRTGAGAVDGYNVRHFVRSGTAAPAALPLRSREGHRGTSCARY